MEGNKRIKTAQRGFDELNKITDSIIVVPNDKVLSIIGILAEERASAILMMCLCAR